MPTHRPLLASTCAIKRVVVVLPLTPVTATTGMRASSPCRNICCITASPILRPLPYEGVRCIRNPGAAFTSTTPPFCSSSGRMMFSTTTSTPQTCKPTMAAASIARAATSGWTSSVTSVALPPVERLALLRKTTRRPTSGMDSGDICCSARQATAISSKLILVSEVACPSLRRGSAFKMFTNSRTLCLPSPITCGGSRRAAATNLFPTTSKR